MPRSKLSPEAVAAFRSRALEAALTLIREGGLSALSMRELATRLGCSATTPYRYFESQEALIADLRTEAFRCFADRQDAAVAAADGPRARLEASARSYVEAALEDPESYRLMFDLRPPPTAYPRLVEQSRRAFAPLLQTVRWLEPAGSPEVVAHLIWAELHGLVSLHFSDKLNFGCSIHELLNSYVDTHIGAHFL